jgi:hypothetical protein
MSFNTYIRKPRLVDNRLIEYYKDKFQKEELKEQIKHENIKQELPVIIEEPQELWYDKYVEHIKCFIKENYGFVIISTLIIILLYVRYIEVKKRKKKMKEIIE